MKILSNDDYKNINEEIKTLENKIRDKEKAIKDKEKIIKDKDEKLLMQEEIIERINIQLKEKTQEIINCNQNLTSKNHEIIKLEAKLLKEIELKQYYRSSNGGLVKENNKLRQKVYILETNVNNFKQYYKETHKNKSINEYDKKLKGINKRSN